MNSGKVLCKLEGKPNRLVRVCRLKNNPRILLIKPNPYISKIISRARQDAGTSRAKIPTRILSSGDEYRVPGKFTQILFLYGVDENKIPKTSRPDLLGLLLRTLSQKIAEHAVPVTHKILQDYKGAIPSIC